MIVRTRISSDNKNLFTLRARKEKKLWRILTAHVLKGQGPYKKKK